MNEIIEALKSRRSNPKLITPAPSKAEQKEMLACALRAPDHACLKPWHYILVEGEGLNRLGKLFGEAYQSHTRDECTEKLAKMQSLPSRAPLVVVAIAKYTEQQKVHLALDRK
jgi:nitroreductase